MKQSVTNNSEISQNIVEQKIFTSNNVNNSNYPNNPNGSCSPVRNTKRKKPDEEKCHKRKKSEIGMPYFPIEELHKTSSDTNVQNIDLHKEKSSTSHICDKENQSQFDVSNMDRVANLESLLNIDFANWEDTTMHESDEFCLDLTQSHHCKITDIKRIPTKVELALQSTLLNKKVMCTLEGAWIYTHLDVGSTVRVTCKRVNGNWIINNDHGLLVYEPDFLLPTTSIVSSVWCKRKSALSAKFKALSGANEFMLVGNIVHDVFQHALENNITETNVIEELINKVITKDYVIKSLYECNISIGWAKDESAKYIPKIQEFIKTYMNNVKSDLSLKKDNWKGIIDSIEDVEENIWCPELGVKGKIDVTIGVNKKYMPLEIKTGKASMSLEHRGQVIFYLMMMKKMGYDVTSGLLLYLKEGILREISASEREERDLIQLRNELIYFIMQKPEIVDEKNMLLKLPEPINHSGCKMCAYKNICVVSARFNNETISSKILQEIQQETSEYLSETHVNYFMKWTCLNILESMSNASTRDMKEIYLTTPEEREKSGRCISNLKLLKILIKEADNIEHVFEKSKNCSTNLLTTGIIEGDYVIVSTSKRHAVATGFIINLTLNSITITLERKISERYKEETFCIDTGLSDPSQGYNLTNLSLLLDQTPKSENLRKIIIDKITPTFKTTLPKEIGVKGKTILRRLNYVQQKAVLKAIAANEYFLIKGMPGTGKTTTIVALIQLFYELKKTVLITSHTNSAVDNVCLKLIKYGVKFIRLGSSGRIHKDLQNYSEHHLTKHCTTPEEYEEVYNKFQIIATTCMSSGHPALMKRTLDACIVDESTQVSQSSIIRPLYSCKTFILIGDPDQLPAVIRNQKARNLGMSESLFERLYSETCSVALNINYRMNSRITYLANRLTYKDELKIGSSNVEKSTLELPNKKLLEEAYASKDWIMKLLDDSLDKAVQIVDIGPVWNLITDVDWKVHKKYGKDDKTKVNIHEAAVIFVLIEALLIGGVDPANIGVIASYRHQVDQITNIIDNKNIDINTVDQFQGKDKCVIIYSSGISKDTSILKISDSQDILEDRRRLNVAVTRAKHKLIIVGDVNTLKTYSSFKEIVRLCENDTIKLSECDSFSWENLLGQVQLKDRV